MPPTANRLSILYLLSITAGVGIAISFAHALKRFRSPIDEYFQVRPLVPYDPYATVEAALYGVCVVTSLFAFRTPHFWSSPGKTLAFLFANEADVLQHERGRYSGRHLALVHAGARGGPNVSAVQIQASRRELSQLLAVQKSGTTSKQKFNDNARQR